MAIRNAIAAQLGLGVAGRRPVPELALLRQCHWCCSILQGGLPGRPDARLAPIIWILPEGTVIFVKGLGRGGRRQGLRKSLNADSWRLQPETIKFSC
ncbi:hypothetical protein ACFQOZ_08925 [Comamonas endophytica]